MASSFLLAKQSSRSKSLALFDCELDDTEGSGFAASDVLQELLAQINGCSSADQRKLTDDAEGAYLLAVSPSGEVNLERFAQLLALYGHHVWLRTGRLECCFGHVALRHTFILAGSGRPDAMPELFVVDPCFKEQFQLPNATPEYQALWQDLPNLFVGTAEQLVPMVELMCTQMQRVFADTATSCPPWRTPSCMLTKWLPSAADDVPVAAPGSSDVDSSSRPSSSSNTNSALSSPAALRHQTSNSSILPPIRTGLPATGAGCDPTDGLTPRSARSPLYFDQEHFVASKGLIITNSPGEEEPAEAAYGPAGGAKRSLVVHWGPADDDQGLDVPAEGCLGDESAFMASGSWGLGTLGSTISSPGCDVPWDLLRSCRSEDVCGRGPRARAMAIGQRAPFKVDQGAGGFGEALVGRSRLGVLGELTDDVGLPGGGAPAAAGASSKGGQPAGSGVYGAYRSRSATCNPTLDISRFDRNSVEDAAPCGPVAWGLGAERFGNTSSIASGSKLSGSSKPQASAGAMCPPVRRRGSNSSSTSSQCSALSAAIASKGVSIR